MVRNKPAGDVLNALAAYATNPANFWRVLPWDLGAAGALAAVCLFWANPAFLAVMLVGLSLIMLWKSEPADWWAYAFCALFGTLAEMMGVAVGAWQYGAGTLLGVPVWLPLLWGIACLFMVQVSREFARLKKYLEAG
ncbi:Uncharacterised protein [uncultured archaeon]|nr:Uncharacterised protein [uncultured archaeon]